MSSNVESLSNIEILRAIKEKEFQPSKYEEVSLDKYPKKCLDKLIELNQTLKIPSSKELARELDSDRSNLIHAMKDLRYSGLIANPTIYELLAVFKSGKRIMENKRKKFENRILNNNFYNAQITGRVSDGVSIVKKLELSGIGNASSLQKYYIALVSVESIPVYSKIFY